MEKNTHPLIVFDMDGTLIDSLPDINQSCQKLLHAYGLPPISPEFVRSVLGDGIQVTVEKCLDHIGKRADSVDRKEAVQKFIQDYIPHAADTSMAFDGALSCLDQFKQKDWKIALCTNKLTKAAEAILDKLRLSKYFDMVAGSDRFAKRKPDPCHLQGIIGQLACDPSRTVMVGDHLNDILVAKNAHIAGSIFAEWGYGKPEMGKEATCQAQSIRQVHDLAVTILDNRS